MSFVVYKSSAGSGKTYTLVKEYLCIVLASPASFRNILAITFTNKAANEMRERIITSLTEISDALNHRDAASVKYMLPEIITATGLDKEKLISNASMALGDILHHYSDFSVCTIDSFIHRVIRTFSFDLRLPLNFEVEIDETSMKTMAVDMLMSLTGIDDNITKVLSEYAANRIEDEKNWDMERDLVKFAGRLLKDDIVPFLPGLRKMNTEDILAAGKKIRESIRTFEAGLKRQASAVMDLWEENGLECDDFYQKANGIWGYVNRFLMNDFSKPDLNSYALKGVNEGVWYPGGLDAGKKAVIDAIAPEMQEKIGRLRDYVDQHYSGYILYGLLMRALYPLAVLREIEDIFGQIRENEGIIHISDFDKRIATLVENEPLPFIYERLGERYSHFLIDEFQDTSVLEWQNLLPLIENSLASAKFNMVVGDPKQAIYRFKGGEVEQLVHLPAIYKKPSNPVMHEREGLLKRNFDPRNLECNYRSMEGIIRFNNDFYTVVSEKLSEEYGRVYHDCRQKIPAAKPGGEVRLIFFDKENKRKAGEGEYLGKCLEIVRQMSAEQQYQLSDIAILCRSNANASTIARFLLLNGVRVVSAESLLLITSPEVNFLLACLDHIADAGNRLAQTAMIAYLQPGKANNDFHHSLTAHLPVHSAGSETPAGEKLHESLYHLQIPLNRQSLKALGLYERTEALIRLFSLNAAPDPYILAFMDVVYNYEKNKRYDQESFTSFWRENGHKYSIVVPEGLDAVKVMTIHKAKGLEFPLVIYPFANDQVNIARDQQWTMIDIQNLPQIKTALLPMVEKLQQTGLAELYRSEKEKSELDLLNILYVATTRPTERLFLLCDKPSANPKSLSLPSLFKYYLENKQLWNEEQNEYVFGEAGPASGKGKGGDNVLTPLEFVSSDWRNNIVVSGRGEAYREVKDEKEPVKWGNIIHKILSEITLAGELKPLLDSEVLQGTLDAGLANEIFVMLSEVLDDPQIRPFFDGSFKVKNEVSIMQQGGKEYRPDRLMTDGSKAIVIDYKTGKQDEAHRKQLKEYGELLLGAGFEEVEKYLLYIGPGKLLLAV
jgi:ATP-dependent exoDNAse (exonuclease V) beta subunit